MKNWSLKKKIYVGGISILFSLLGALAVNLYTIYNAVLVEVEIQKDLLEEGVRGQLLQLVDSEPIYRSVVQGAVSKMKLELGSKKIPAEAEANQIVDSVKNQFGSTATIFVKEGDDFVRYATNVIDQNGQRAVGTKLARDGSAYAALTKGTEFFGQANILGKTFYTGYSPIFSVEDGGNMKVVGAVYSGYELHSFSSMISYVSRVKILNEGFFLVYKKVGDGARKELTESNRFVLSEDSFQKWLVREDIGSLHLEDWTFDKKEEAGGYWLVSAVNNQEMRSLATQRVLKSSGFLMFIVMSVIGLLFYFAHRLEFTLSVVAHNAESIGSIVASTAVELSSTGQSLSSGANEAAASVEETVASLEQLVAMVRRNADGAKNAQVLTKEAQKLTEAGELQSQALLQAMNRVRESSARVSEIVTVIDDIAFQTNLLALNASVEAARAGDHGKGFAVVAEAVRSLAQKSADSARDIGKLISESSEQVSEGNKVALSSAKAFEDIKVGIVKLTGLVSEIADASAEQSDGLQHISQAMGQFDTTSQTNAAAAEQAAAVSEDLSANANELSEVVAELQRLIKGRAA